MLMRSDYSTFRCVTFDFLIFKGQGVIRGSMCKFLFSRDAALKKKMFPNVYGLQLMFLLSVGIRKAGI